MVVGVTVTARATLPTYPVPSHSLTGSHAIQLRALDCAISTGYL